MPSKHTPEQRDEFMKSLVLRRGNVTQTHAALRAAGVDISRRSIDIWKQSARYAELEANRAWIFNQYAEQAAQSADVLAEVEQNIARDLIQDPTSPGPRAKALKDVTDAKVKNVNLHATLEGRPTTIHATLSVPEMMRALQSKFGHVFPGLAESPLLESTAEEVE